MSRTRRHIPESAQPRGPRHIGASGGRAILSTVDPGVAGIIGGAVGSVLTGLVRAFGIPSEVRAHDAAIRDRDDQLATWVADRDYALGRKCDAVRRAVEQPTRQEVAAENLSAHADTPRDAPLGDETTAATIYGERAAEADRVIADARALALHEHRDQERQTRLDATRILASEGWAHRLWRRLSGTITPALTTPARATPVLDSWRRPSSMNPRRHTFPDDATKRTLDDAIASVSALGP